MKKGWQTSTFGQLGRVFNGNSISENDKKSYFEGLDQGVPYIGTKDVSFDHEIQYNSGVRIPDERKHGFKIATPETIFVCAEGGSAGRKIALTDRNVYFGNKLYAVCLTPPNNSRFVFYYCLSDFFAAQFNGAMAGLIGGVSLNKFKKFSVDLPPLPEQRRIVGILDEAFAGIASAKANAEKNLQNARALLETHLQSVFTQRGEGWVARRLGDVFYIGSSKRILETEWTSAGVPFYGGKEIVKLAKFGTAVSNAYISEEKYRDYASKYDMPRQGDILITARGTIGVGYIVQECDRFYYKDGNIISLRWKTPINPHFILYAFRSNVMADQLGGLTGTTVRHLPIEKAKELVMSIPGFAVQNTVSEQIREIEEETQSLETIYERKLAALDALKKSLLHQAFTGEL